MAKISRNCLSGFAPFHWPIVAFRDRLCVAIEGANANYRVGSHIALNEVSLTQPTLLHKLKLLVDIGLEAQKQQTRTLFWFIFDDGIAIANPPTDNPIGSFFFTPYGRGRGEVGSSIPARIGFANVGMKWALSPLMVLGIVEIIFSPRVEARMV